LKDESSSNGTFVNQVVNRAKETDLREDDLIFFSPEYSVPASLLSLRYLAWERSGGEVRGVLAMGQVRRFTEEIIRIGSDSANELPLAYLEVWPQHAAIHRQPHGGYVLQDFGGGCRVDGQPIVSAAIALQPTSTIEVGGVTISTSFDPAGSVITVGAERRGFYVTARRITYSIPAAQGSRNLLDRVSFSVMPGELIGLLGPSGCGKTTLLTCLAGIHRMDGVLYNGKSLEATATSHANVIGYVPQDDILFPELTVLETLFFSARVRLGARTSDARILAKIDEVCAMLGLVDTRAGLDLRHTRIGSPERKTLSGGQKKRVNLALELLTDPLVLFLDEPTSGLSSRDTRVVMESLRRLADEKGLPIIITIHQPSLRVYELFDHTLFLKTGRLAWFGPAHPDSVDYFFRGGDKSAGPDEIMEFVDSADAEQLQKQYDLSRYAQKMVQARGDLIASLSRSGDLVHPTVLHPLHPPGQWLYLLQRQWRRRIRDLGSLIIQIGQAPLLGAMVGFAFHRDRMNSPLFLLGFIAIWFGANATARELVSERHIFRREKRGGVSSVSTLAAKLTHHALILLVQSALLFFSAHAIIGFDATFVWVIGLLWCCGMCGVALGFFISALARTEIAATVATPLVLVPLILFGGYLAPYDNMPKPIQILSEVMPTRWGYQGLVELEKLQHHERTYEREDRTGMKAFVEFSSSKSGRLVARDRWRRIWVCLEVLGAEFVALSLAAWRLLKKA
jgi:ABC-type multidrug transport system ATPase subunit